MHEKGVIINANVDHMEIFDLGAQQEVMGLSCPDSDGAWRKN